MEFEVNFVVVYWRINVYQPNDIDRELLRSGLNVVDLRLGENVIAEENCVTFL